MSLILAWQICLYFGYSLNQFPECCRAAAEAFGTGKRLYVMQPAEPAYRGIQHGIRLFRGHPRN